METMLMLAVLVSTAAALGAVALSITDDGPDNFFRA
jgi:hypothetical protein